MGIKNNAGSFIVSFSVLEHIHCRLAMRVKENKEEKCYWPKTLVIEQYTSGCTIFTTQNILFRNGIYLALDKQKMKLMS